jgi:hypothetical protein
VHSRGFGHFQHTTPGGRTPPPPPPHALGFAAAVLDRLRAGGPLLWLPPQAVRYLHAVLAHTSQAGHVCDTYQASLATEAGVSERVARRWERRLAAVGWVRVAHWWVGPDGQPQRTYSPGAQRRRRLWLSPSLVRLAWLPREARGAVLGHLRVLAEGLLADPVCRRRALAGDPTPLRRLGLLAPPYTIGQSVSGSPPPGKKKECHRPKTPLNGPLNGDSGNPKEVPSDQVTAARERVAAMVRDLARAWSMGPAPPR